MQKATLAGVLVVGAIACGAGAWYFAGLAPAMIGVGGAVYEGTSDTPRRGTVPPVKPPAGPARAYAFRFVGAESDLPWNRSLWVTLEKNGKPAPPLPIVYFEGEGNTMPVLAVPGTRWSLHSEASPNAVIEQLLFTVRQSGTFSDSAGDAAAIDIPLPRRALIRLTGDEVTDPGEDLLTVAHEASGARLVAARRPLQALRLAVWDASQPPAKQDWRTWTTIAPPRPWVFDEIRPDVEFVLAAKCAGKQWIAARVKLRGGEETAIDVARAAKGGGTVTCDDPDAELLLNGELPIPAIRLAQDFYRAVWRDVPPGQHIVRRPGGKQTVIDVKDGADVKVE